MKIKIINPNTTQSMTDKIGTAARSVASSGTEIVAVSPSMGPVSIEGHYDEAIAAIGVLDEVRKGERQGFDGYIIACFGDPGLLAAREIAKGPVIGIAEAAMHAASLIGTGFSIVSMLDRSRPILEHLVHAYGMERKCRGVRTTDVPVLELENEGSNARAVILEECRRALREDKSDSVLLGCAGLSDLFTYITAEIGAPAIDGVTAATKLVEAMVGLKLATSKVQGFAYPERKPYRGMFESFAP